MKPADLVRDADSVQICLSKGLGAPMGSLVCASRAFVERARFWRKRLGGGLRQVGIVAAAGLYALRHNIERLAEDHENARKIASILADAGLDVFMAARPIVLKGRKRQKKRQGARLNAKLGVDELKEDRKSHV